MGKRSSGPWAYGNPTGDVSGGLDTRSWEVFQTKASIRGIAVNVHDDLVEALMECIRCLEASFPPEGWYTMSVILRAGKAIGRATGAEVQP